MQIDDTKKQFCITFLNANYISKRRLRNPCDRYIENQMTKIWYKSTLLEYDGPQIFEARDRIGGHYIAVAVEENETDYHYMVVGTEVEKLRRFRVGELDLRSLLIESSQDGWYLTAPGLNEDQSVSLLLQQDSLLERDYLPGPNFYLHDSVEAHTLVSEARARDNLVVEIITDPPESETGPRIPASTLSGLMRNFQLLVYQAYRDEIEKHNRVLTDTEIKEQSQMDVVIPAAAGSFRVLLEASNPRESYSNSELASALHVVDNLFAKATGIDQQQLDKPIRSGSLSQFDNLLKFLDENNTNLKFAWAEPQFDKPRCSSISTNQIQSYLATTKDLPEPTGKEAIPVSKETDLPEFTMEAVKLDSRMRDIPKSTMKEVKLVGEIERVNRKRKTWALHTADGHTLTGVVDKDGDFLNGLIVGVRYEFICSEVNSDQEGVSTKYVMKNYKAL